MKKINIPMMTALILLLVTMISFHFTSGLYARYTSTAYGSDGAEIAEFHIETDLDYITLGIADNESPSLVLGGEAATTSVQIPFYIESRSQVSAVYSVKVDFGTALPDYMTIKLTNGTQTETIQADGQKTEYEFAEFANMSNFTGTALDPGVREELVLEMSISNADLIVDELSMPTAILTVKVDQVD